MKDAPFTWIAIGDGSFVDVAEVAALLDSGVVGEGRRGRIKIVQLRQLSDCYVPRPGRFDDPRSGIILTSGGKVRVAVLSMLFEQARLQLLTMKQRRDARQVSLDSMALPARQLAWAAHGRDPAAGAAKDLESTLPLELAINAHDCLLLAIRPLPRPVAEPSGE